MSKHLVSSHRQLMLGSIWACLLLAEACVLFSNARFSRVTIPSQTGWVVTKECGTKSCFPSNDHLVKNDFAVRIDALNYLQRYMDDGILVIRVMFPGAKNNSIEFDPSSATVGFMDGRLIQAKGVTCVQTGTGTITKEFAATAHPLMGYQTITPQNYCYFLYFDTVPPHVTEHFSLQLPGIKQSGQLIDLPKIEFRPGPG